MLGILSHTSIAEYEVDSVDALHCQIEAMKLAFADIQRYVADPDFIDRAPVDLLDDEYLASRAAMIDMNKAQDPGYGVPARSGTIYLTTADQSGMMVSYIQSNYCGFGSGIVIPDTGISLQNRGSGFHLRTVIRTRWRAESDPSTRLFRHSLPVTDCRSWSFGVMGAHMQTQGHAQIVQRVCDQGYEPPGSQ